jgi:hypothetical protein
MYVHVGRGKTGTTFLQEEIFSKIDKINYIAKTENNYPEWLIDWHYADDFYFIEKKEEILITLNSKCNKKINLLSSEAFSIVGDVAKQANRIYEIVPNAKIIITLRDPISSIISFYKYSVKDDGFIKSLENSIDWGRTPMAYYKRAPIYIPDFYYNEIIERYKKLFGKSNVLVLKFEDMLNETETFFNQLGNFINVTFDINNIKNILKVKVNNSPKSENIDSLRFENINKLVVENFDEIFFELKQFDLKKKPMMSIELKNKIISDLEGKCFGYY